MLIDEYLPTYDVRSQHSLRVDATPVATYAALRTADFASAPLVRGLLALRALPRALRRGPRGLRTLASRGQAPITLGTFEERGFRILADDAPRELVIGLEGRFWRPSGDICTPSESAFRNSAPPPGHARAVWNFTVVATADGTTELATETRVQCADDDARRRFLPYWFVGRHGSGIIREAMLRSVRATAERGRA